jgi:hypothetical protein
MMGMCGSNFEVRLKKPNKTEILHYLPWQLRHYIYIYICLFIYLYFFQEIFKKKNLFEEQNFVKESREFVIHILEQFNFSVNTESK